MTDMKMDDNLVALISCYKYIFSLYMRFGRLFLIDTHQTGTEQGGNGNGTIKICENISSASAKALGLWIRQRLLENQVHRGYFSFLVMAREADKRYVYL